MEETLNSVIVVVTKRKETVRRVLLRCLSRLARRSVSVARAEIRPRRDNIGHTGRNEEENEVTVGLL